MKNNFNFNKYFSGGIKLDWLWFNPKQTGPFPNFQGELPKEYFGFLHIPY